MANFKIGLSMLYTLGEPFEKMVQKIPKTGVKHIEVVDDGEHCLNKKRVEELKEVGSSCGIKFAVHAPFSGVNIALESTYLLNTMLKRLKESIVNASALDSEMWVLHPGARSALSQFYPGEDWVRNLESCKLLLEFAREHGVKIGVENVMGSFLLKNVPDFQRFYDDIGDEIGLVLDTGHANLYAEIDSFLRSFPEKLAHVHAHDNLGQTDQHLGIGYGNINWTGFSQLIKKTSFNGIVIVESVEHLEESVNRIKNLLN